MLVRIATRVQRLLERRGLDPGERRRFVNDRIGLAPRETALS
jgi:hypothetical protein